MNSELERIWREGVVAKFKAISQYFPGGNKKKKKPQKTLFWIAGLWVET
jgi:hypothetical protein